MRRTTGVFAPQFSAAGLSTATGTQERIFGGRSNTSSLRRRRLTSFIRRLSSPRFDAPSVTQP